MFLGRKDSVSPQESVFRFQYLSEVLNLQIGSLTYLAAQHPVGPKHVLNPRSKFGLDLCWAESAVLFVAYRLVVWRRQKMGNDLVESLGLKGEDRRGRERLRLAELF